MRPTALAWLALAALALTTPAAPAEEPYKVGVAKIDITPKGPIRLNGFGFRRTESEGVTQRIWAKALAVEDASGEPALVIAVDILGIPIDVTRELAHRFETKAGLKPDRLAITASHTHTAPMLARANPTIFGVPIPPEQLAHIDAYTREFLDKLEQAGLAALADRKSARLSWGVGRVGFARNRRPQGGPVDHDLPLLVVRDSGGQLRAVWVSYACHCVTLSNNKVSGDWAGFAQEAIQDAYPGATALVSIGCGADQNPNSGVTGDKVEIARMQGQEVAAEVKRLLDGYLAPVTGRIVPAGRTVELPLGPLPDRAGWEAKAKRNDAIGYHAKVQLARLDRGESLRTKINYPVQLWAFGDSLAMLFLPGEVVVDYSQRLKRELDGRRLWVNAYANDAPCYIPSERVLKEGGYEGGGAMIYYDVPVPFAPGLEEKIIGTVKDLAGPRFTAPHDPKKVDPPPPSPQQAVEALRTKPGMLAQLVAAEPLIASPVAIDFGRDGRLWVAEMVDYPSGETGRFEPGGRIRVLTDTDGDGIFDTSTVFLDQVPFPTGITVWRDGVQICAAPDILYAEEVKGTGRAGRVVKLYSGFGTGNYQARVNSLEYGLDGWVYGSCGLFGGTIRNFKGETFALGDRDFRLKPDTGALEPATGRTQQGRVRDDWDNWFGCDNSTLVRHSALADHYLRRNPRVPPPNPAVYLPGYPDSNRLFPVRSDFQRFKLSGPAGLVTAACGIGIYRDDLLGKELTGNAFVCEPVNLVVHREVLSPRGSTFTGRRAPDEQRSEFLASTDNWFRPVQVRTGPDGCLWVVDMARYVIEHPRWIPPDELARVDVRAGHNLGRIYRIRPTDKPPRTWQRLDKLDTAGLVAALDSPNGWQRDMAMQMLLWRRNVAAGRSLTWLAQKGDRPETRLQALCTLDRLGLVLPELIRQALKDEHAGVRRHAVRLAERFLVLEDDLTPLCDDPDPQVRLQLAYSLGEFPDGRAGTSLARLALRHADDPYLLAAVWSSVRSENLTALTREILSQKTPPAALIGPLVRLAAELNDGRGLPVALQALTRPDGGKWAVWQMTALAEVIDRLPTEAKPQTAPVLEFARRLAADSSAGEAERVAAIGLLGRGQPVQRLADAELLAKLLTPQQPAAVQSAVIAGLARLPGGRATAALIDGWKGYTPALKSQVLDALLSRPRGPLDLLAAVQDKAIPAAEIDAARRQRLLQSRDEPIRILAARVFDRTTPDRQQVLHDYQAAVARLGDPEKGKAVFARACATCHRLHGTGHEVGPDLAALAVKTPQYLLQEILDPNRNVDTRYVQYQAVTKAGLTYTGLLAAESAGSVTLRAQEGKEQVIPRAEIDELFSSGKSLMPEGLEKDITPAQMADLLAYVAQTTTPPKPFAGNRPEVVRAEGGRLTLRASACEIRGGEIAFEGEFRNVGMWHGAGDHVTWRLQLDAQGAFDVWLDYACADDSAGNRFILEGGDPALHSQVVGTGGWDRYRRVKVGTVTLTAGQQALTVRADGPLRGALLDLRTVYLVPRGTEPPAEREGGR